MGSVHGAATQDFLMVNQPVFAFANVEDYEVLSRVLVDHHDDARPFFAERLPPAGTTNPTPSQLRAMETGGLVAPHPVGERYGPTPGVSDSPGQPGR